VKDQLPQVLIEVTMLAGAGTPFRKEFERIELPVEVPQPPRGLVRPNEPRGSGDAFSMYSKAWLIVVSASGVTISR